ncbi:hypothetical protein L596_011426 [Steinernema carpocapsae]|uniref:Ground-like domain-containing protein n=1 Tax=Steinernema carpocapsae TaxID=34508 RepID=A0A4U5NUT2_STECR|nr:hypothetical protein L596_011426 [Steinernema carpocapsae]
MLAALLFLLYTPSVLGFLFPMPVGGCQCPQPACPPPPPCHVAPQCPQALPCAVARGQKNIGSVKALDDIEMKAQILAGLTLDEMKSGSQLEILEKLLDNVESKLEEDHDLLKTRKTRQAAVKVDEDESKNSDIHANTKCNSQVLKRLMIENMTENSSESKKAINKNAEIKFGGNIDVICSRGHFSYVYSSNLFCEAQKGEVTCVAFRQSN